MENPTTSALRPLTNFPDYTYLKDRYIIPFKPLRGFSSPKTSPPLSTVGPTEWLARAAACALVVASAGFGAVFAWQSGQHNGIVLGALSVLFAISLDVSKPLALRNALSSLTSLNLFRAIPLALLVSVSVVYSLTAELNLWSALKSDTIAARQMAITATARADDRYTQIKSELDALSPARTAAEANADITTLFAANPRAGDCSVLNGPVSRSICPRIETLKAEIVRSAKRDDLRKELATFAPATSTKQPQTSAPISTADPGAANLATYLNALGFRIDVNVLSNWLALTPVIALEIGSLFAGLLSQPSTRTPPYMPANRCSGPEAPTPAEMLGNTPQSDAFNAGAEAFTGPDAKLRVSTDPGERLMDLLRNSGGALYGGQRTIARAIGTSAGLVNALLRELEAAGRVTLAISSNGTRVKLAA